jgi:hypothetical protein
MEDQHGLDSRRRPDRKAGSFAVRAGSDKLAASRFAGLVEKRWQALGR